VDGSRRLSQAIAEGDGISVLVEVVDAAGARAAQEQGAQGLVVRRGAGFAPESCDLPVLAFGSVAAGPIDAVVVDATENPDVLSGLVDAAHERGLECVLRVTDEDDLGEVLELVDPEIFLLASEGGEDGQSLLERLLELLADVPAGKLAIADLAGASRDDVVELERAGVDAVIVSGRDIASLVGDTLPDL
jgi:hypothetical protein